MAEYIERDAAIAALNKVRDDQRVFKYATASDFLSARGAIERAAKVLESLPAADVEPVVRCRECKHHYWVQEPCHGKSVHYCKLPHMRGIEIFKEFFCYYGEQKEGAD